MTDYFKQLFRKFLGISAKTKLMVFIPAAVVVAGVAATAIGFGVANSQKNNNIVASKASTAPTSLQTSSAEEKKPIEVSSIKLDKDSQNLKVGETFALNATVLPEDAEDKTVTFKSDNEDVATVSDGKVTAIKAGKCNVTASTNNGVSASCSITVIEAEEKKSNETAKVKTASTKKATKVAQPKKSEAMSTPGFKNSAFNNTSQVIAVVAPTMTSRNATVSVFEKNGGQWQTVMSSISALVGKNGLAYDSVRKQETDKTPAGIYNIEFAFGWASNPGTKIEYRVADDNSYWNENSGSSSYNRWVEGCPGGEFEQLKTEPLYKHALVLSFNWGQKPGKGAGIFIHDKPSHYTGGCVGIDDGSLVNIMRWIDPSKNTKVLICPKGDFSKYYN